MRRQICTGGMMNVREYLLNIFTLFIKFILLFIILYYLLKNIIFVTE